MPSTAGVVASGYSDLGSTYDLLRSATLWLDADKSPIQGGYLYNLGTGGEVLNARFGSSTLSDTSDPLVIPYNGKGSLFTPAAPSALGNCAQIIKDAGLDSITNEVELVGRLSYDSSGGGLNWISKHNATCRSWLTNTGGIVFWTSDLLSNNFTVVFGQIPTQFSRFWLNGDIFWLKITRRGSDGRVQFFVSPDKDTEPLVTEWVTAGADQVNTRAIGVDASINNWYISTYDGFNEPFSGRVLRVIVRGTISGPAILDVDFSTLPVTSSHTTFTCSTGQTVNITRGASGRKTALVLRNTLIFGSDDYLEVADNDLLDFAVTDDFTVVGAVREWTNAGTLNRAIVAKQISAATGAGYHLYTGAASRTPGFSFRDSTTSVAKAGTTTPNDGSMFVAAAVVSRSLGVSVYTNTSATTLSAVTSVTGSSANSLPLRIGAYSDTTYSDFEFFGAAIFRRALSASEIAAIVSYYGAG